MKSRRGLVMFVVGLILALCGLAGGSQGFGPQSAQATTTGCANFGGGDLFGCYVSGNSSSYAFRADNAGPGGNAKGLFGYASGASGVNFGVFGLSASPEGRGVYGQALTYGVEGWAMQTVDGMPANGVWGISEAPQGSGVYGTGNATSGLNFGVFGISNSTSGKGVSGFGAAYSGTNYGVYGKTNSSAGYAGYFNGRVQVVGDFAVLGAKSFKIDHPLDPSKKYLYHAAVESPDMKNVYDGVIALDSKGQAVVELPKYFEALNQEFRYQLTAIGAPGPNLYIAEEIKNNSFTIAGGEPGMKVSWQVTGIRHDPYAEQHRMQVEQDKPAEEQGTYLYPQGYGKPESMGRDYADQQPLDSRLPVAPAQSPAR